MKQIKSPTNLVYSGKVSIKKFNTRTKKVLSTYNVKNAGTVGLFNYLCDCLIGQGKPENRPRYLDASKDLLIVQDEYNVNFSSALYYRSLIQDSAKRNFQDTITLTSGESATFNLPHIQYTAVILASQLQSSTEIKSLALYNTPDMRDNSSNSSLLAWINIPESTESIELTLEENQALFIEWDLSFNNYVTNDVNNEAITN